MHLVNFDSTDFLANYWQKKPLLIRNAWDSWINPADENDVAGLACEEEVESRLIEHSDEGDEGDDGLTLTHGPMAPERLQGLGPAAWTLLVQAVDQFIPEVADLIEPFRFVPDWRIDDVMVSLANDGGGVGPHFDQYDVFLIQGAGKRRWQIGQMCDAASPLLPHDDLRLLADFDVRDDWVLEPGDMLYVPPGIAHNGVAEGDGCMTYSIGFRAPATSELLGHFADHVLLTMTEDARYSDPELVAQDNPGAIAPAALQTMQRLMLDSLSNPAEFARWAGEYATASKYPDIDWQPDEPFTRSMMESELALGQAVRRNPAKRFAFTEIDSATVLLFVNGESYDCDAEMAHMAQRLCRDRITELSASEIASETAMELVVTLYNSGALELVEAD